MQNQVKKIGIFFSIMMMVGSVVGIGIFFKNNSVAEATNHNGITWLLAWIIGGIISISSAVCFGEIGSFKHTKLSGISNWTYKIAGNKLGYFVNNSYALFYYGILISVIGIFGSEIFFYFLSQTFNLNFILTFPLWMHILVGIFFSTFFLFLNFFSVYISAFFQTIVTIIKFIPLLFALIVGIIFPFQHNIMGFNAFYNSSFSIKAVIVILPAILFSYDAFLVSGSIGNKVKNSEKNLPRVIIVGMSIVTILYTLIAVSSILHNQGSISQLILDSLKIKKVQAVLNIILFFLIISTFGVINGLTSAFVNEIENMVSAKLIFGSDYLTNKLGFKQTTLLISVIIKMIWGIFILIPSLILNTDILIDAYTNFVVAIFFMIYMIIIFLYAKNRKTIHETKKINSYLFYLMAFVAVIGILVAEIGYFITTITFLFNSSLINPAKWGLFLAYNQHLIKHYLPFLLNILMIFIFIFIPYLNFYLEKKINKRNLISEFANLIKLDNEK
ncbi:APC family permease [Mycoplasma zalophi]|uniref:APC family permease n=1 Tax=Mycoplasma zalophi TaxID=191287 RepID=A0ABS6DRW2_9MOLU|nr:APC family permease [Mycoplasma zalophi]MBU4692501.1 APC family permease [Mycoplasma zalophi]